MPWPRRDRGGRETSPRQPLPQSEPALGQPALDCRHRPVELPGRLVVRHPLEVAQLDRAPVLRRQPVQLLTHGVAEVPEFHLAHRIIGRRRQGSVDPGSSSLGLGPGPTRDAVSDPVEPAAERPVHPHRSGLADENEEGGLEGVLGLVGVAEHAVADPPDHRSVPIHQGREGHFRRCRGFGRLGPPGRVPLKELAVGEPRGRPRREQGSQLPQCGAQVVPFPWSSASP